MSEQPEALVLADHLEHPSSAVEVEQAAASQLRKLYFENEALKAQRQPLTYEWIRSNCYGEQWVVETVEKWVRLVEAAHGIGKVKP